MKNYLLSFVLLALTSACQKALETKHAIASSENNNSFQNNSSYYEFIGRQRIVFSPTGDRTYPIAKCLLWVPPEYKRNKEKKYPLIINLYGVGQNGANIETMLQDHTMSEYIAEGFNATAVNPIDHDTLQFIVFSPQCPVPWGWSAPHVKTMLETLKDSLHIDATRIYITGFSAGGWGLWSCVTDDTALCAQFAAIVPISSAAADHPDQITNVDKYGLACWDICGDQDAFYTNNVHYVDIINANNPPIPAVMESLRGVGHSAWVQAYDSTWRPHGLNLYEWLLQYHK